MAGMGTMAGPMTSARGLGAAALGSSLMTTLCIATTIAHEPEHQQPLTRRG